MQTSSALQSISNLEEQLRLLDISEQSGVPFVEVLSQAGLTYENLVYEVSRERKWLGRKPPALEEFKESHCSIPLVSFFSGCGGMDLGFEAVGYKHVAAFEISELFCNTLRRNRPTWNIFGPPTHSGDVSNLADIRDCLSTLISDPFDGVFIGGPPCTPFSIASNQRFSKAGDNYKRVGFTHETNGNLLFDFLSIIFAFKPKAFVVENVPGLRDIDDGVQLKSAIEQLKQNGYRVTEPFVLNAADYSVPQKRQRLFIIGTRSELDFRMPTPDPNWIGAGSVLVDELEPSALNAETREHKAESIMRYMRLAYGERDPLGRVDRLDPTSPSKTVIAGGSKGGGRSHLHPEIPRTLSVRECARLQTFPDDYVFVGPPARQFTQVGNAVPPVLAAQIAQQIFKSFF